MISECQGINDDFFEMEGGHVKGSAVSTTTSGILFGEADGKCLFGENGKSESGSSRAVLFLPTRL